MAFTLEYMIDHINRNGRLLGLSYDRRFKEFHYKAFHASRVFFVMYPRFDWGHHIDSTFRKCMKPMTNRMMRVV